MFTEISTLLNDRGTLCINIIKTGETLAVTVFPQSKEVKDPAAKQLIPLVLKGTPEELDAEFVEAIKEPVLKSVGLQTNMAEYEQSVEKAERESRAVKEREDKIAKYIKEAETAEKANKYKEALAAYNKALELDSTNTKIKGKISSVKSKMSATAGIFAFSEETAEEKTTENRVEDLNDDNNEGDDDDTPEDE